MITLRNSEATPRALRVRCAAHCAVATSSFSCKRLKKDRCALRGAVVGEAGVERGSDR